MAASTEKNFRRLNNEEKKIILEALKPTGYRFWGEGSREVTDEGKINYHLSFDISPAVTVGTELGQKLRRVLGADEVFRMGCKL